MRGEMRKEEGREEIPYSPSASPSRWFPSPTSYFSFVFVCLFFSHPAPVLESPCNFLGPNPNINETNVKKMKTAMKVHRLSQKEVLK